MPTRYECIVYGRPFDLAEYDDEWLDEERPPLVEVARWLTIADEPRGAAARAWVRTLGRERVRTLIDLNAPVVIIEHDRDPRQIAAELTHAHLWIGECWMLDNKVEKWYVVAVPAGAWDSG